MHALLDIAVPLASNALTIFVGSGFSKYLTDGTAPNWLELLVELTEMIDRNKSLEAAFFNTDKGKVTSGKLDLMIIAQMLELEYQKRNCDIRETVAHILEKRISSKSINPMKLKRLQDFFAVHPNIAFITTNYDTLISHHVLQGQGRVIVDGSPIPKRGSGFNVLHIHGCTTNPQSLVLTISDYFRFQHTDTYLSRKFFTLLQETTILILGYSLGDFNLNNIFNEAQISRAVSLRKADIYLVSRNDVDALVAHYYKYTYGIQVLASFELDTFFSTLQAALPEAEKIAAQIPELQEVLNGSKIYTDAYLQLSGSFRAILLQASTLGTSLREASLEKLIRVLLEKKKGYTCQDGAWSQYEQLAEWLIELATFAVIRGTPIESAYLESVGYSFSMMSKDQKIGYSWAAYSVWASRFTEMLTDNQSLIREHYAHDLPSNLQATA